MADDDTKKVRDLHKVHLTDEEVRHYSADGLLYAYREGDEHIIVSQGNEPHTQWTKRVPAERDAVLAGEHLWTIPENWQHRVNIHSGGEAHDAIYYIPDTGVDVVVTVPSKDPLMDAWYGVKRVGTLTVTYDDKIDLKEVETTIKTSRDTKEISDDVLEALETVYRRRRRFEKKFVEEVERHAKEALFSHAREPISVNGWTAEPWEDNFSIDYHVNNVLKVDKETREAVLHVLSEANVVPRYPTVRVDVEEGEGVPEGYNILALVEAGVSGAESIDYLVTKHYDLMTETDWAEVREKESDAINKAVSSANGKLLD